MGNSFACLCPGQLDDHEAIVMKENGAIITFKKGVLVEQVVVAHPGYKIMRCGSDRSVLPDHFELEIDRLYFLMPEKLVRCGHTYNKFVGMAESKGLLAPTKVVRRENYKAKKKEDVSPMTLSDSEVINGQVMVGQFFFFESSEPMNSPWRPGLQTIPEAMSPRLSVFMV